MFFKRPASFTSISASASCARRQRTRRASQRSVPAEATAAQDSRSTNDFASFAIAECTDMIVSSARNDSIVTTAPGLDSSASRGASTLSLGTSGRGNGVMKDALCTAKGADVVAHPGRRVLNHFNSCVWLPVLSRLHMRGLLSHNDIAGVTRFVPAQFYVFQLSSLFVRPSAGAVGRPSSTMMQLQSYAEASTQMGCDVARRVGRGECVSVQENDVTAVTVAVSSEACSQHKHVFPTVKMPAIVRTAVDLRLAPATQWLSVVESVITACSSSSSADFLHGSTQSSSSQSSSSRLAMWHDMLFALAGNVALTTGTGELLGVHSTLLTVLTRLYDDLEAHLAEVPIAFPRGSGSDGSVRGRLTTVSIVPPLLMRRLRKAYRAQYALMQYAELFRTCLAGEQRLARAVMLQCLKVDGVKHSTMAVAIEVSISTTFLQDAELFEFYLTIPGRRECGLHWERQWALTLEYARLSFTELYRQSLHDMCGGVSGVHRQSASGGVSRAGSGGDGGGGSDPCKRLGRAASALMNVCMWVRNDNLEGDRCREVLHMLILLALECCADSSLSLPTSAVSGFLWEVTKIVRSASIKAMTAKTQRLHYGPSPGLLDVATLSAALDVLRPASDGSYLKTETAATSMVKLLLHSSKPTAKDTWLALSLPRHSSFFISQDTHSSSSSGGAVVARRASRYALVTVGPQLARVVAAAAINEGESTARRLLKEVREWAVRVGQPLRLCHGEAESLWRHTLQRAVAATSNGTDDDEDASGIFRAWDQVVSSFSSPSSFRDISAFTATQQRTTTGAALIMDQEGEGEWACGCGYTSNSPRSLTCVACACRNLVSAQWECSQCHWTNRSGEELAECLSCGAAHPLLAATAAGEPLKCGGDAISKQKGHECRRLHSCGSCTVCEDCGTRRYLRASTGMKRAARADAQVNHSVSSSASLLLRWCDDCRSFSLSPNAGSSDSSSSCCSACTVCSSGSPHNYLRSYFTWRCGCGAVNSPTHAHCWQCTETRLGDAEEDGTTSVVTAAYSCHHCGDVISLEADSGAAEACPRCHEAHPRYVAALETSRLVLCPACSGRVAEDAECCPHCEARVVKAVLPLIASEADMPWRCLTCGEDNEVRSRIDGHLLSPSELKQCGSEVLVGGEGYRGAAAAVTAKQRRAHTGSLGAPAHCRRCYTARVPVSVWEQGTLWRCGVCGETGNRGACCRRCRALFIGTTTTTTTASIAANSMYAITAGAPSFSALSSSCSPLPRQRYGQKIHLWTCSVCHSEHNPSWERTCATPGCGGQQPLLANGVAPFSDGSTDTSCSSSVGFFSCYSPWECEACGAIALSSHATACTECGAVNQHCVSRATCDMCAAIGIVPETAKVAPMLQPAAEVMTKAAHMREEHEERRLKQLEALLLQAGSIDADASSFLDFSSPMMVAASADTESTLGASLDTTTPMTRELGLGELASVEKEDMFEEAYASVVLGF